MDIFSSPTAVPRLLFTNNFDCIHVAFTNVRYNKITGKPGIKQKGNDIMPKFNVGDHVVSHCDFYGITKTGWTGVVTGFCIGDEDVMQVRGDNGVGGYTTFDVKIDDFDLVGYHDKIVITTDGKTTTATHYDGKRVIRKEIARCNPDDKFDFLTGAEIAFDRLTGREETKKRDLRELLTPGVFGKSDRYGEFVVIGNVMTFKDGGWMALSDYSADNLETTRGDKIEYIVKPTIASFNIAEIEFRDNKNVVWKRK